MRKTPTTRAPDALRPEYRFDYGRARPNRFAGRVDKNRTVVVLDADISKVFSTPQSVNTALRALISAMPKARRQNVRT